MALARRRMVEADPLRDLPTISPDAVAPAEHGACGQLGRPTASRRWAGTIARLWARRLEPLLLCTTSRLGAQAAAQPVGELGLVRFCHISSCIEYRLDAGLVMLQDLRQASSSSAFQCVHTTYYANDAACFSPQPDQRARVHGRVSLSSLTSIASNDSS